MKGDTAMSYEFPVKLNTKVHKQKLQEESSIDWAAIDEKNQRDAEMNAIIEHNEQVLKEQEYINKKKEHDEILSAPGILMEAKLNCLASLGEDIPNALLSEAFGHIYIKACSMIHDQNYVNENMEAFKNMASMYIRKLGGMKYLKARCESTNIPFLNAFYNACDEAAKKIIKEKSSEIINAITEDEARDILNGAIKTKNKQELIDKIDSLGSDQLALLIRNKVVDVVRDEQLREKDEREQRTILKNDLISGEPISDTPDDEDSDNQNQDDESDSEDIDIDDEDLDIEDEEDDEESNEKDKKKKDKKEAKESFGFSDVSNWNPVSERFEYEVNTQPKSLFFAMNYAIAREMVESVAESKGESITKKDVSTPEVVMENPLNLDIFMEYLKDNSMGYDILEKANTHEPEVYGGTAPVIDHDKILTESLVQYTLLESANTMRLIDVTPEMVQQQSDYLLRLL